MEGKFNYIPNEKKYISFTKKIEVDRFKKDEKGVPRREINVTRDIRFIDSFKFYGDKS